MKDCKVSSYQYCDDLYCDFQKSREEEIVGLLQQITHECHQVADQVYKGGWDTL